MKSLYSVLTVSACVNTCPAQKNTESGQEQEQTSLAFHGCSPQLETQYEDLDLGTGASLSK